MAVSDFLGDKTVLCFGEKPTGTAARCTYMAQLISSVRQPFHASLASRRTGRLLRPDARFFGGESRSGYGPTLAIGPPFTMSPTQVVSLTLVTVVLKKPLLFPIQVWVVLLM